MGDELVMYDLKTKTTTTIVIPDDENVQKRYINSLACSSSDNNVYFKLTSLNKPGPMCRFSTTEKNPKPQVISAYTFFGTLSPINSVKVGNDLSNFETTCI